MFLDLLFFFQQTHPAVSADAVRDVHDQVALAEIQKAVDHPAQPATRRAIQLVTMEQLAATPVSRVEIVVGKLLPYLAIGLFDLVVVSILGVVLFGMPFRGDPFLLLIMSGFFLIGALGLGIFISAISRSQLLATQIAMVATFLPTLLLSGFMFAIEVMPPVLRMITYIVPARYFLVVTRGIFLKGVGVEVLYIQGLIMVVFAGAGLWFAARVFKKELR